MRIIYYSQEYLTLWVQGEKRNYEYPRVSAFYYNRIKGYIRRGFEGKAWQILQQFEHKRGAK